MTATIARPAGDEYGSFYAGYIGRVPEGDVLAIMAGQAEALDGLLRPLTDDQANRSFAPGEWTVKEVAGHLIDAERIFAHRLLCVARADPNPLPGFEQDDFVREADYGARPLDDLLDEWGHLRRANLLSFRHLTPAISQRRGLANGLTISVRALVYILVGHTIYHLDELRARYLPAVTAS